MMLVSDHDPRNLLSDVTGDVCSFGWSDLNPVKIVENTAEAAVSVVKNVVDEVDDINDAAADFARGAGSAFTGLGSTFVDGVTHVAHPIGAGAWDLAKEGWDATRFVGARGVEMIGAGAAYVGPAVSFAGDVAEVATLGLGDDVLDVIDDAVLDGIDEITDGAIDIDYDDGGFSVDVGIDDVIGIGLSIGEDGISTESEVIGGSLGMGLGDDGLLLDVEGGIDKFPLPYVDTHIEVDPDGNVVSNGTLQGPVPYPVGDGILAGRVSGGFERNEDGWAVEGEAEGVYYHSDGTQIKGQAGLAYAENEDGSAFSAHAAGSIKNEYGEIGGGVGYTRIEQDGEVLETFEAEGSARGFGMEAEAAAKYVGIETAEGSVSAWETDSEFKGLDADSLMKLGAQVLSDSDVLPDSVDGLVGQLGAGGTSSLLDNLDEAGLGQVVAGLGGDGAADLVHKMGEDGTAAQFVNQLPPDAAADLVAKVADSGGVEELLGGLDTEQTAALVRSLAAAQRVGTAAGGGDDLLGVETPVDDLGGLTPTPADGLLDDPLMADPAGAEVLSDTASTEEPGLGAMEDFAEPVFDDAVPAVEPEPTVFDETIESVDAFEDSMDDLFEGLD